MNARDVIGLIVVLVIGLSLTTTVQSFVNDGIQGDLIYYTTATVNSDFSDNTGMSPDNWTSIVTNNRGAAWDNSGYVFSENDNGTAEWYQSITINNLNDGVSSATIAAKFRLVDNVALTSFTARVIFDNGTDNNIIWESTSTENSASYTSIENDVKSYAIATGTYTVRLFDNVTVTNDNSAIVRWDDASLTITTSGYEPMTGVSAAMLQLVPLFYVIGLLLAAIAWATKKLKK